MEKRLTKKRKEILLKLLDKSEVLGYLSSEYCDDSEEEFIDRYGATFDEAQKAIDALLDFLEK